MKTSQRNCLHQRIAFPDPGPAGPEGGPPSVDRLLVRRIKSVVLRIGFIKVVRRSLNCIGLGLGFGFIERIG